MRDRLACVLDRANLRPGGRGRYGDGALERPRREIRGHRALRDRGI
jgi:hypothetical protein